jgi:hypothetical protein
MSGEALKEQRQKNRLGALAHPFIAPRLWQRSPFSRKPPPLLVVATSPTCVLTNSGPLGELKRKPRTFTVNPALSPLKALPVTLVNEVFVRVFNLHGRKPDYSPPELVTGGLFNRRNSKQCRPRQSGKVNSEIPQGLTGNSGSKPQANF